MTTSKLSLLDTNILVYADNIDSPYHEKAEKIREEAKLGRIKVCVSFQNLLEFYSVMTNPKRIENCLSPEEANQEVEKYLSTKIIRKIGPKPTTLGIAIKLNQKLKVVGQKMFDLFLAATMLDNGVKKILTANEGDFKGFDEIEAINPFG